MNNIKKFFYPHTQRGLDSKNGEKVGIRKLFFGKPHFLELGVGVYKNSVAWSLVLLWMVLIFIFSSVSDFSSVAPVSPGMNQILSVLAHIFLYSILTVLSLIAILSYPARHEKFWRKQPKYRRQYYFSLFLIIAIYGFSDEWHQVFTPKRDSSISDWLVDIGAS